MNAQGKKFSAALTYAFPLNEENFKDIYDGTAISGDFAYEVISAGPLKFDLAASVTFLEGDPFILGTVSPFDKVRSTLIQPRIQTRLDAGSLNRFHPVLGVGYTAQFVSYDIRLGFDDLGADTSESYGGINVNFGLQYDFAKILFVTIQYDYTRLFNDQNTMDFSRDLQHLGLLKTGIGLRL